MKSFDVRHREIGGWRLRLFEDGEETGGGVFETLDDAMIEGQCWAAKPFPVLLPRALPATSTVESLDAQIQDATRVIDELIAACPPQAGIPYTPADVKRFDEAISRETQRWGFLCEARGALLLDTTPDSTPN
ncbi:hypothetical protein [Paraburkholderia sp. RL17-373-BIF-A]|uniref:hypothetical protein n=1 Tax=Paraburkholderia sp. RL17-373-BIF-A TaxID=3031629 RepID=UPI0038B96F54